MNNRNDEKVPKPYDFVSFPPGRPNLQRPYGHHKYDQSRLHGTIYLTLKVKTSLHISTGAVVLGSDIGQKISLIKTMTQGVDNKLSIQGSSLKGCIRSVYEAITNSTLGAITSKYKDKMPSERLPCRKKEELCPASRVFGALDWQGLIEFNDANCENVNFATGFMPSLYSPRVSCDAYYKNGKLAGRKFYYNMSKAIDKKQGDGISVQQAGKEYTFKTELHFKNLLPEELGTLLIILGQDQKYPLALKVGGGKPIGMGTMTVNVDKINRPQNLKQRYSSYQVSENDDLTGDKLKDFIQKQIQVAHSKLIAKEQLDQLVAILRYPTDRTPPAGMY
ncbi:CRISPR-associated protein [Anabaena sp. FACHB-1237]|uniref:RAMP superfamily CRISPR-associated protein n=1 Tax=Anabaena sp. FACHB-1237 TaxID=2692769 RepID=UPI0016805CC3|nr:RAMP superfamily CRISPR-associated protein [Anabaena sp. FACHB-1237]MBD2137676.1 CRISPR-associated protein [Anabaena sp. FACHB-1237]